jgi:hypothetical protein
MPNFGAKRLKDILFGVRVFGILPTCVSVSWILPHHKIYLQTTDLDTLFISTTVPVLSIWVLLIHTHNKFGHISQLSYSTWLFTHPFSFTNIYDPLPFNKNKKCMYRSTYDTVTSYTAATFVARTQKLTMIYLS